jgi:hypothetical protein
MVCYECGNPLIERTGQTYIDDMFVRGRTVTLENISTFHCANRDCVDHHITLPEFPRLSQAMELVNAGENHIAWNGNDWEAVNPILFF